MKYVFDIDGTICSTTDGDYEKAEPFEKRIKKINELYEKGETIFLYTARGMGRSGNSRAAAHQALYGLTRDQLTQWGVRYDALFMGKPSGDIYVDDKGVKDEDFFAD
tara:strand:- start:327 stop:647 length:321 start_codon:yes stop_codon:yes gene_type:complete